MLDVLRGVAVLAVFTRHLGDRFRPLVLAEMADVFPAWATSWLSLALERTHWGVDLFFVLSGFTLGMGFTRDHARGTRRTAWEFFARRAARILPGFYVAVLVHVLLRADLASQPHLGQALAWHALLLQGYYSPDQITIIGASWSLTTESHFYVAAPWLAHWLLGGPGVSPSRWSVRRVFSVLFVVCITTWVLRGVLHDIAILPTSRAGMLELTQRKLALSRVDQFCLGLGAAVLHHHGFGHFRAPVLSAGGMIVLAFLLLGFAVPYDAGSWGVPGGNPAYACVSLGMALLVLGAAALPQRPIAYIAPLRALGVISYGVFLYHQLALELVPRWFAQANAITWAGLLWTALPSLALSFGLGAASWYLIESPALALASGLRKTATP